MVTAQQLKLFVKKRSTECESTLWTTDYTLFGAPSIEEALGMAEVSEPFKTERQGFYELPYKLGVPFLTVNRDRIVQVETFPLPSGDDLVITVYQFYSQGDSGPFDERLLRALQEQGTLPNEPIDGKDMDIALIVESAGKARERAQTVQKLYSGFDICLQTSYVPLAEGRLLHLDAPKWHD